MKKKSFIYVLMGVVFFVSVCINVVFFNLKMKLNSVIRSVQENPDILCPPCDTIKNSHSQTNDTVFLFKVKEKVYTTSEILDSIKRIDPNKSPVLSRRQFESMVEDYTHYYYAYGNAAEQLKKSQDTIAMLKEIIKTGRTDILILDSGFRMMKK